ncbi:MAG: heavy-metal-associated domain-containing protein [Rubripirellula sp.]
MRGIAYVIAVIAAVGIMITIGGLPGDNAAVPDGLGATETTEVTQVAAMADSGTLTLSVPEMMCPFSCYPRVKKTLESTAAVTSVELTPQKVEGEIDNRQVIVNYDAGFKLADALKMLQDEGFNKNEIVQ